MAATDPNSPEWKQYHELVELVSELGRSKAQLGPGAALMVVRAAAEKLWGMDVEVNLTGSLVQGTAINSSDLDISLKFPLRMKQLSDKHYLKQLHEFLDRCPEMQMELQTELLDAPLPLLTYYHPPGAVTVDITVGSPHTGKTDKFIAQLVKHNVTVLSCVFVIKHWAQQRRIAGAFRGYLNSISWVALLLAHCQKLRILPHGEGTPDTWCSWTPPAKEPSTAEVLLSFFKFINSSQSHSRSGQPNSFVYANLNQGRLEIVSRGCDFARPVIIDDPGKVDNNLASSARRGRWDEIVDEARRAETLLKNFHPFSEVLAPAPCPSPTGPLKAKPASPAAAPAAPQPAAPPSNPNPAAKKYRPPGPAVDAAAKLRERPPAAKYRAPGAAKLPLQRPPCDGSSVSLGSSVRSSFLGGSCPVSTPTSDASSPSSADRPEAASPDTFQQFPAELLTSVQCAKFPGLTVGTRVAAVGLHVNVEINGATGCVSAWAEYEGVPHVHVRFDENKFGIKSMEPKNLVILQPQTTDRSSAPSSCSSASFFTVQYSVPTECTVKDFQPGMRVVAAGLQSDNHLNGGKGFVSRVCEQNGVVFVHFDDARHGPN
eukprot:gene20749-31969_t